MTMNGDGNGLAADQADFGVKRRTDETRGVDEPRGVDETDGDGEARERVAAALEALLMASDGPLSSRDAARVLHVDASMVEDELTALSRDYDGDPRSGVPARGFALKRLSGGWRLVSRAEFAPLVMSLTSQTTSANLSPAALEALAIISYKQPMTRSQVSAVRGVNSDGVVRILMVRGLVEARGEDSETHAALLVTTDEFLDRMGMASLSELPDLAPMLPDSAQDALSLGLR